MMLDDHRKKRLIAIGVLAAVFVLGAVLSGVLFKKDAPAEGTPPEADLNAGGYFAPEPAIADIIPGEGDGAEYVPVYRLLDANEIRDLETEAEKAMKAAYGAYEAADKGSTVNVTLSKADLYAMVKAVGDAGYACIDYFETADMQNPQILEAFGEALNLGLSSKAAYYVVHPDGKMHANVLMHSDDGTSGLYTISMEYTDGGKVRIYSSNQHNLPTLMYTQGGKLIFTKEADGSYFCVRVGAYGDDKRALEERYLSKISYTENNLFTVTWDGNFFNPVDFNSLYPILHGMYYGVDALIYDTATPVAGFSKVSGTGMHVVPYEQFERVIQQFFNVSTNTLRNLADNSSEYEGYFMLGYRTSYYGVNPHYPEPEIESYHTNSDGSITLRVNAVDPWQGTDKAFTHDLTVMETEDGFKYLSNTIVSKNEEYVFPTEVLKIERKFEVAGLKKQP